MIAQKRRYHLKLIIESLVCLFFVNFFLPSNVAALQLGHIPFYDQVENSDVIAFGKIIPADSHYRLSLSRVLKGRVDSDIEFYVTWRLEHFFEERFLSCKDAVIFLYRSGDGKRFYGVRFESIWPRDLFPRIKVQPTVAEVVKIIQQILLLKSTGDDGQIIDFIKRNLSSDSHFNQMVALECLAYHSKKLDPAMFGFYLQRLEDSDEPIVMGGARGLIEDIVKQEASEATSREYEHDKLEYFRSNLWSKSIIRRIAVIEYMDKLKRAELLPFQSDLKRMMYSDNERIRFNADHLLARIGAMHTKNSKQCAKDMFAPTKPKKILADRGAEAMNREAGALPDQPTAVLEHPKAFIYNMKSDTPFFEYVENADLIVAGKLRFDDGYYVLTVDEFLKGRAETQIILDIQWYWIPLSESCDSFTEVLVFLKEDPENNKLTFYNDLGGIWPRYMRIHWKMYLEDQPTIAGLKEETMNLIKLSATKNKMKMRDNIMSGLSSGSNFSQMVALQYISHHPEDFDLPSLRRPVEKLRNSEEHDIQELAGSLLYYIIPEEISRIKATADNQKFIDYIRSRLSSGSQTEMYSTLSRIDDALSTSELEQLRPHLENILLSGHFGEQILSARLLGMLDDRENKIYVCNGSQIVVKDKPADVEGFAESTTTDLMTASAPTTTTELREIPDQYSEKGSQSDFPYWMIALLIFAASILAAAKLRGKRK